MSFTLLIIIILVTVIVSLNAFKNHDLMDKFLFVPYKCKHDNQYYRFLSHILIHADATHLIFNMLSLYLIGSKLEREIMQHFGQVNGEIHFLLLYILGGLFATLIPFARNHDNWSYRSLGASGSVSAIVFAAILWDPKMELGLIFLPIYIPAYIFGPIFLAIEYWADKRGGTGIAHDAHIGGAIFGILYVLIINIDKGKEFFTAIFG